MTWRLLVACALLLACGCGGGGGGVKRPTVQELAGEYAGTWIEREGEHSGSIRALIAPDGGLTGTFSSSLYGEGLIVSPAGDPQHSSAIKDGGEVLIHVTYPEHDPVVGDSYFGKLARSGGALVGTLQKEAGDFTVPVDFRLERVE